MRTNYKVNSQIVRDLYRLIGLDETFFTRFCLDDEVYYINNLEYLIDDTVFEELPVSSQKIAYTWLNILDNYYEIEDNDKKELYINSVKGIINTVYNLNLIKEDEMDYKLLFERINTIILHCIEELENLDVDHVILMFNAIKNLEAEMSMYLASTPTLMNLVYLSMSNDIDSEDYQMFEKNESSLNVDSLNKLIADNIHEIINVEVDNDIPKRLNYIASLSK